MIFQIIVKTRKSTSTECPVSYKELVRIHIETLIADGMPRDVIAAKLGVKSNYLSMILLDRYDATLPLQRLPLLCGLCGLTGTESLRLVRHLTMSGARRGAHLNQELFDWLLRCADLGLKEQKA